jgi:hypothetical protein
VMSSWTIASRASTWTFFMSWIVTVTQVMRSELIF